MDPLKISLVEGQPLLRNEMNENGALSVEKIVTHEGFLICGTIVSTVKALL